MRWVVVRNAAVIALVTSALACADPTLPSPVGPVVPAAPKVGVYQPLTRPGTVYLAPDSIYRQSQGFESDFDTRFVLYDDGAFALEFKAGFAYTGHYTRTGGQVTFFWDGWSAAGPWGATGEISGDALTVRYNIIMLMSDFMDGTYRLATAP